MSFLQKAGNVNDFPKDFKYPETPEKGTIVKFKLLQDPINEILDGKAVKRYPTHYTFRPDGFVYDPASKRTIRIACVLETDDKGNMTKVHKIRFNAHLGQGVYALTYGNSPQEDMAYMFLMMSSERQREKDNDEDEATAAYGVQPTYVLINDVKNAKADRAIRDAKHAAYIHAKDLKDEELRDIAILLGQDDRAEIEVMRNSIEYYADAMPKDYLQRVNDEDMGYRTLFKKALASGTIYQDNFDIKWSESKALMFSMRTNEAIKASDEFVYWIRTNDIAKNAVTLLRKKMDDYEGVKKNSGRPKANKE